MRPLLYLPLLAIVACTSPDPDPGPGASDIEYRQVVYADGRFVAVGGNFTENHAAIATSVDGLAWNVQEIPDGGSLLAVAHGGGRWVAVGRSSTWLSDDATAWWPVGGGSGEPTGIAYGNGVFVVTTDGAYVSLSADGESWTAVEIGAYWWSPEVVFASDRFIAYGEGAAVAESTDGETWGYADLGVTKTHQVVPRGSSVVGVGYYDCCFGEVEGTRMAIVTEGPGTWSPRVREGLELSELVFVDDAVIGVTFEGLVRGPDSGLDSWALEVVAPADWRTSLASDGASVVAAGRGIRVSHDAGATWTQVVADE